MVGDISWTERATLRRIGSWMPKISEIVTVTDGYILRCNHTYWAVIFIIEIGNYILNVHWKIYIRNRRPDMLLNLFIHFSVTKSAITSRIDSPFWEFSCEYIRHTPISSSKKKKKKVEKNLSLLLGSRRII